MEVFLSCSSCNLHTGVRHPCIKFRDVVNNPDILFVGDWPEKEDDLRNTVFSGPAGNFARVSVRHLLDVAEKKIGRSISVSWASAIRCCPYGDFNPKYINACKHYLMRCIEKIEPKRIITFGDAPIKALLGEKLSVFDVAEGWIRKDFGYGDVPIQFMISPKVALDNTAYRRTWKEQLRRVVLKKPDSDLATLDKVDITIIDDPDLAVDTLKAAMYAEYCSYDIEYNTKTDRILCYSISTDVNSACVFPEYVIKTKRVIEAQRELFELGWCDFIAQNWKFDAKYTVKAFGFDPNIFADIDKPWIDSAVLRKCDNAEQLAALEVSEWMVGMGGHKGDLYRLLGTMNKSVGTIGDRYEKAYEKDPELVMRYCGGDTIAALRVALLYKKRLEARGLLDAWKDVMNPVGAVLFRIERNGMRVDPDAVKILDARLEELAGLVLETIRADKVVQRVVANSSSKSIDAGFNPQSDDHMRELLFSPHGFRFQPLGHTKGGKPTSGVEVRKHFEGKAGVLKDCTEYVRLQKLRSTYVIGWIKRLEDDGYLHTTFNQDVARTGRLSSSDPNL